MSTDPGTNWNAVYAALFLLQWAFNLGCAAWLYFRKADTANSDATVAVERKLDAFILAQNGRMTSLEEAVKHLPTDEEVTGLREDVAVTKTRVEGIERLMERVDHQVTLIHQHLLR